MPATGLRGTRTRSSPSARGLVWALAAALTLLPSVPAPLQAQGDEPPSGYRKWLWGAIGGLAIGLPASLSDDWGVGGCGSRNCFAPIAAAAGATAGFLIGLELDKRAARTWVRGPAAELRGSEFEVPVVPTHMTAVPEGVALLSPEGVTRANPVVGVGRPYAARGLLATAVLARHEALVAASASAIVAFHEEVSTQGARQVFTPGGAALAGDGGSQLVLGGEGTLRRLSVEGTGTMLTVTEAVTISEGVPARDLAWADSASVIWELAGNQVVSRSAETLEPVGSVDLAGPGRFLVVQDGLGLVAGGESGVSVLDLSDPEAPAVAFRYDGVRYAFDVEVVGTTAYVAAGEQGLVMLDVSDPGATVVSGVVGNLGMPYAVVVSAGRLYVLDRENGRLHVIQVAGESEATGV